MERYVRPQTSGRCLFCGEPMLGRYRLAFRPPGGAQAVTIAPISSGHWNVLRVAGAEGRIYRPTGVRWWLRET